MKYTVLYLYNTYKTDVYNYIFSLTHSKTLSEDIVSETFLTAISALSGFKEKSLVKTWLFGIARNKWYEHLRREKNVLLEDFMLEQYAEISLDNRLVLNRVHEILEEEGSPKKEIFLMRVWGYSFLEIALKYNISENSARVIDFRLRKKIKEILKKEGLCDE